MITVGSLFSGIGGIELGLERAGGFQTIWFCENDSYASAILKKHWPEVPNLGDITKVKWETAEKPDMLTGGFPCQDISVAGHGKGIREGQRSGLWKEYAKAICSLRPKIALIENVSAITHRGLDVVLADLASMGYDAEWGIVSASAVGALHKRERLFVFAYHENKGVTRWFGFSANDGKKCIGRKNDKGRSGNHVGGKTYPSNNKRKRIQRLFKEEIPEFKAFSWCKDVRRIADLQRRPDIPHPLIRRSNDGIPRGVDGIERLRARSYKQRIRCIGNAVVPQCAETIGYWIKEKVRLDG